MKSGLVGFSVTNTPRNQKKFRFLLEDIEKQEAEEAGSG
jgi:hypothetical protein